MSVILLNQSVIHYESIGRGRPVLFLHTWVGSWRYWVPSLQAVAVSHSAYALDFFGFGGSARGAAQYSMESQAALVGAFLDEMGIDRIALVGHGLGGLVGLHFAGIHPQRVARMLVTGLSLEAGMRTDKLLSLTPDELLGLLAPREELSGDLLPEARAMDPDALRLVPDLDEIQRSLSAFEVAGSPILIINGAIDPLQAEPELKLSRPNPHLHEIILPESGHFPMLDAADGFRRLMVDFLALESGMSPRQLWLKEEWHRRVR